MTTSDAELHRRGVETLLASWEVYARAATGARLHRRCGVAAAVFPDEPERSIYNNALLDRADAIGEMEALYAAAGVTRFAAWVHESDTATRAAVAERGYVFDSATRAMAVALSDVTLPPARIDSAPLAWRDYVRMFELPDDLLADGEHDRLRLLAARVDGVNVAAAMAFDHDGDCGIYNVGTLDAYRRRGLATALTALQLRDAATRGCSTASVQSTPIAERVYAAVGFRDLGRYLEFVPGEPWDL